MNNFNKILLSLLMISSASQIKCAEGQEGRPGLWPHLNEADQRAFVYAGGSPGLFDQSQGQVNRPGRPGFFDQPQGQVNRPGFVDQPHLIISDQHAIIPVRNITEKTVQLFVQGRGNESSETYTIPPYGDVDLDAGTRAITIQEIS